MIDIEKDVLNAIRNAITAATAEQLKGYGSPFRKLIDSVVQGHEAELRELINEAISGVLLDKTFRKETVTQIQHKVARELTSSFGEGIFKKTMDQLKSNPTVKARCVMAVENIVTEALNEKGEHK